MQKKSVSLVLLALLVALLAIPVTAAVNMPVTPGQQRADGIPAKAVITGGPLRDPVGIPAKVPWFPTIFLYIFSWAVAVFLVALITLWDRPRSATYPCRCTRRSGIFAACLYTAIGVGLTFCSFIVLREFQIASMIRGTGYAYTGVGVTVTCTWLAVSSFMLGYHLLYARPVRTLLQVHFPISLVMTGVLYLFALLVPERRGIPVLLLAILVSLSALLSAWHLQQTVRTGKKGGSADTLPPRGRMQGPAGDEEGFPDALCERYVDAVFIGEGGSARVFSARRREDGRKVAVKVPRTADEETGASFLGEIRAWEELNHPNILPVTAVNILPLPYVEMPYIDRSLEEYRKPVAPGEATALVMAVADGLAYAHRRGFIHRDLKPANILLSGGNIPQVTDWGTSRKDTAPLTGASGFSPSYAAPEQVSPARYGETGAWTDIWQLGVVLYELVTGTLPFPGPDYPSQGRAILYDTPEPPSRKNPQAAPLDAIVLRCLEKEPSRRFGSMEELREALARVPPDPEGSGNSTAKLDE